MTIFYPDYSSYQGQADTTGVPAIVAKATEGNYYKDADYVWYRTQAAKQGVPFSGYHFLKGEIDPAQQALYYFNFAGKTPCMLDVETEGSSRPSIDQVIAFIEALERLGGRVWGAYIPKWYWELVGGDLGRLTAHGVVLISSNYTSYSESGPGWNSYGGATPTMWQYTSGYKLNGTSVDYNAFKGTAAQLAAIINGDNMNPVDVWAWRNPNLDPMDMRQRLVNAEVNAEQANAKADQILAMLRNMGTGGGASAQAVAAETLAELKAKL